MPSEIAELLTPLNMALELDEQALKLTSPSDAERRAQILAQVDETLANASARAIRLQAVASQRTRANTVLAYVFGALSALVATVAYACLVSFHRKYRTKRTFQMKISLR
jgi:hypothetical protein